MGQVIRIHTRKITFELMDEHPEIGHYCVFANDKPEDTKDDNLDFIFVQDIQNHSTGKIVVSPDLAVPVMLKYCWRIKMTVHD